MTSTTLRTLFAALLLAGGSVTILHLETPERPTLPSAPVVHTICKLGTSCS